MVDVFIGTRPEAIKLAPVVLEMMARDLNVRVIASGQHSDIRNYLDVFGIEPDVQLEIPTHMNLANRLSHLTQSASEVLNDRTSSVMVQGDTATVFAAAVAAFSAGKPVLYVEAGLRTHNLKSPFPEEGFRQMVSRIAAVNFTPTSLASRALRMEGLGNHIEVGNTIVDGVRIVSEKEFDNPHPYQDYILVTCHRKENLGFHANRLATFLRKFKGKPGKVVVVGHPNPEAVKPFDCEPFLIDPVPYGQMLTLLKNAALVITDSGGLVEEATILGVPTAIFRDTTERTEALRVGTARMAFDEESLIYAVDDALNKIWEPRPSDVFGDGKASERIVTAIIDGGLA